MNEAPPKADDSSTRSLSKEEEIIKPVPVPPGIYDDEDDSSEEQDPTMGGSGNSHYVAVLPKIERIPWYRWVYLSVLVAIPTAIYILYFSAMGWGEVTFNYFGASEYTSLVAGTTVAWFILLYMLDANAWQSRLIQVVCGGILIFGICMTVLFLTARAPFGPICCYAAVTPLWLLSAIQMGRRGTQLKRRTKDYVTSLSGPLFVVSMLTMAVFLAWVFVDESHEYNQITKVTFAQASGCEPNLNDYPHCSNNTLYSDVYNNGTLYPTSQTFASTLYDEDLVRETIAMAQENDENVYTSEETGVCFDTVIDPPSWTLDPGCDPDCPRDVYSDCPNTLILWAGPLMVGMVLFFLSFFCTFLKGNEVEKDIINFGKLWLFLVFIVWITASLGGVGAGISTLLVAMTLASFVGAVFFVFMTRSKQESKEQAWELWAKFEEKCGGYLNVGRGIFLVFTTPILILYFFLAIINQAVRKQGLPCSKKIKSEEERADFITKRARLQLNDIRSWERTKVLTYGVYIGLIYLIMSVVITKFTYLLLTMLVQALKNLNVWVVTAILIAFGLAFFLNPFLPGPPVYMTNGLVIIVVGEEVLGLYGAMAYGIVLSVFVKLLACTMQQKAIGENLAKYITVRRLVGINTSLIKAARIILSQPGINIDKVSILVGGPDWPTSVLCGMLHLDLFPILVGTLPVITICAPTSLMGALLYLADQKNDEGDLIYPLASSLAAVATAASAFVMTAAPVMAAYYIEQTVTVRTKEIEAIPDDEEVKELEEAEEAYNRCYEEVVRWEALPNIAKLVMYLSFTLMVEAVYIILLFSNRCFAPYTLASTINKDLGGDWTNLVKPLGWLSIAFLLVSWALVYVFGSWASRKARAQLNSKSPSGESTTTDDGVEQRKMLEAP